MSLTAEKNRIYLKWLILAGFAVLIGFRIIHIFSHSPEYDEIWTVQHYVNLPTGRILSDVATPNNHVLNSLGIKFFRCFDLNPVLSMRLPALLGFAGLFLLLFRGTAKLLRHKLLQIAVPAVVLLDGMILHYAETARGYSLQVFFVFGLLLSLLCFDSEEGKNRRFNAVMWLICAVGSCLSVSSGVIFAAVLTGLWGILEISCRENRKEFLKKYRELLFAGIGWSVFVLLWYGGNYSQFAQGRKNFGESFVSVGQYFSYCGNILWTTGLLWPLLVLAGGVILLRRKQAVRIGLLTGGAVLLMLLSALFTKGGPARVYLPLVPVAVLGAGMVLDEILEHFPRIRKYSWIPVLGVVALSLILSESRREASADPDLGMVFSEVKKLDSGILIAYRPTDLYVVLNLFGNEARMDYMNRLQNPSMLLLLHDNLIGTMRFSDSGTMGVEPGCPALKNGILGSERNMPYWLYRLRPVQAGENLFGKAVLCVVHGSIPELHPQNSSNWLKNNFSVVNGFLTRGSSCFCFAAEGAKLNADELLRLEQNRPGRLFFRIVSN